MLPSGMIATFPCCIGEMLVSGTLEVRRWSSDQVSAMYFPCGCFVEEVGDPVVSTLSKFCWVDLFLLITVLLPTPPYQRSRCVSALRLIFL